MDYVLTLLQNIYPLSEPLREYLLHCIKEQVLRKNEFLLMPGQISRKMCFICDGLLRAYKHKDGQEVTVWFMQAGDFIVSVNSFYEQKESTQYIQALKATKLAYISYDDLEYGYKHFIELNFHGRALTIKYFLRWDDRLDSIVMHTARERYNWLVKTYPDLALQVDAKDIASWLGIRPVRLSQIKGDMAKGKRKNIIRE